MSLFFIILQEVRRTEKGSEVYSRIYTEEYGRSVYMSREVSRYELQQETLQADCVQKSLREILSAYTECAYMPLGTVPVSEHSISLQQ